VADHRIVMIKDMFFTRMPPSPILSRTVMGQVSNSIRKKNTLVLGGKLGEPDELYGSEKPL
jgi:hypothetical protein